MYIFSVLYFFGHSVQHVGSPDQGPYLGPQQHSGVLTTGPQGNSLLCTFLVHIEQTVVIGCLFWEELSWAAFQNWVFKTNVWSSKYIFI